MKNVRYPWMEFYEVEYKYPIKDISEKDLQKFIYQEFDVSSYKGASGRDHFFEHDPGSFVRYRQGLSRQDAHELTVKRKTSKDNSWSRIEIDIELPYDRVGFMEINAFMGLLGHRYEFSIQKENHIYYLPDATIAYYTVNGTDRYLEIEINKGAFSTQGTAFSRLNQLEQKLSKIGLSSTDRLNGSLYEIYKG